MFIFSLFQKRYRLPADGSCDNHALTVFHENATTVVRDTLSYVRIQANNQYLWEHEGRRMNSKRESSSVYLTEEQYRMVTSFRNFFTFEVLI